MAKAYIGVNGVAKSVKGIFVGVNGVAKKVTKAYAGVNGVAKLVFSGGGSQGTYTIEKVGSYGFSLVSSPPNPDSSLYAGVYASENAGAHNTQSVSKITFSGYPNFTVYIRSYAESNYDYSIASTVDAASYPTAYNAATAKAHTRGNQQAGTAITNYTKVEYPNDGGEHFIYVVYRKDSSQSSGDDKGYFLVVK